MSQETTGVSLAGGTSHRQGLENQIGRRAQELYEARGREEGHELDDWLRAEEEITRKNVPMSQESTETSIAMVASHPPELEDQSGQGAPELYEVRGSEEGAELGDRADAEKVAGGETAAA